ncbi:MAG: type II toxin-antitoxin system Phd/YefM family antitoxin [Acidobacteriota bacterium]
MTHKTMPAGEFKTHCLRVMDEVSESRQTLTITKHGRPVAQLVPVEPAVRAVFGCLRGEIEIVGDIVSPAIPPEAWEHD